MARKYAARKYAARKFASIGFKTLMAGGAACAALFVGGLFNSPAAHGEDAVLEQMLGDGMHAFFDGDYVGSFNTLTTAIHDGSHDPRVFYFRGLDELQLGRSPDAGTDFEKGAKYEAEAPGEYQVSSSLERIQGPARHSIELFREHARAVAFRQSREPGRGYAQGANGQPLLLRHEVEMIPAPPGANAPGVVGAPASAPPTAQSAGPAAAPSTAAGATPSDAVNPFESPAGAKPAELPGGATGTVVTPAPGEVPAVVPGAAPAIAPVVTTPAVVAPAVVVPAEKPAGGDPFGGAKSAEKASAPDASSNPFGDTKPAAPQATPPASSGSSNAKTKPGAIGGIFRSFEKGALDNASKPASSPAGTSANPFATPNPSPATTTPASANPFGNTPPQSTTPSTAPAKSAAPTSGNPFGDDTQPPKNAATPATPTTPTTPPAKKTTADPFGN